MWGHPPSVVRRSGARGLEVRCARPDSRRGCLHQYVRTCGHLLVLRRIEQSVSCMSSDLALASPQLLTDQDLYLFNEGSNYRLHEKMGAPLVTHHGQAGAVFSVWAPNARSISVVGSFNEWASKSNPLSPRASSGVWEVFCPSVPR